MRQPLRIGNAQAFWGDRGDAAAEMLSREPELDYLTMDYLAEVSMSILALQRERDPNAGFARDFVDVVRSLAPYWSSGGRCRLIVNAGGLNPRGCADACRTALDEAGCRSLSIGVVKGDDVLEIVRASCGDSAVQNFRNLDTRDGIND
ncbi:MAG: acyclic terpene utilization AtuA family protein, partial [Planctomycetota bacterium]|nr:acyclic terpene utilization AtuA family protein [Planctomycetota bacterium]